MFLHLEDYLYNHPGRLPEHRYVEQHGPSVLHGVMEKLFDELFPSRG